MIKANKYVFFISLVISLGAIGFVINNIANTAMETTLFNVGDYYTNTVLLIAFVCISIYNVIVLYNKKNGLIRPKT